MVELDEPPQEYIVQSSRGGREEMKSDSVKEDPLVTSRKSKFKFLDRFHIYILYPLFGRLGVDI
jgi:hypothetical protein